MGKAMHTGLVQEECMTGVCNLFNPVYIIEGCAPKYDTGTLIELTRHYGVNVFPWGMEVPNTIIKGNGATVKILPKTTDTLIVRIKGVTYSTYTLDGRNSYVLADAEKEATIDVVAGNEYILQTTNNDAQMSAYILSKTIEDLKAVIWINNEWESLSAGANVQDEYHFIGQNAFAYLSDIPADMTKGIRVINIVSPGDGKIFITITANTYTNYTYDGRGSYCTAGKTKTFELASTAGTVHVFESTTDSSDYSLSSTFEPKKVVTPEIDNTTDDVPAGARIFDLSKTNTFVDWVGSTDVKDYIEIINFTAGSHTLTMTLEDDADARVSFTLYSSTDGTTMTKIRTVSTRTSTSLSATFSAGTRYFIYASASAASEFYTIQIT